MSDFKAKMHQIRFRLGFRPRPRWGAYSYSAPPYLLAGACCPLPSPRTLPVFSTIRASNIGPSTPLFSPVFLSQPWHIWFSVVKKARSIGDRIRVVRMNAAWSTCGRRRSLETVSIGRRRRRLTPSLACSCEIRPPPLPLLLPADDHDHDPSSSAPAVVPRPVLVHSPIRHSQPPAVHWLV